MAGNRNSVVTAAGPLYICHGGKHDFTVKAEVDSPWVRQGVSLNRSTADPELPITTHPKITEYQPFPEHGATWTIDCPNQPADAGVKAFQLWAQTEFTSPAYKIDVSLGHHRLELDEMTGDEQFQVIEFNETSTLKAREISYYTREAMPFEGQWKLNDENLGPAKPGADGRVSLDFKKTTAGSYPVRVVVPSLYYESGITEYVYDVKCLALTPWGNDALLQINDKTEPDVLERGVVCTRGKPLSLKLLNGNLLLKGSSVSVTSADAKALGLTFNPDLNVERPIEGAELTWSLTSPASAKSGMFKLQMHCSKLKRDWDISGHLLSADLKDEVVKVEVNGSEISDFGALFFRKETRSLAVTFAESMRGLSVAVEDTGSPGMTYDPPLKTIRKIPNNLKLEWQVTGGDSSGVFTLQVVCADVETPLTIPSRVLSKVTTDEIQSLKVNGETVELTRPELLFFRAGTYDVELIPKPASSLIGLNVALKRGSGKDLGMTFNPLIGQARSLTAAGLKWTVTGGRTESGLFELLIDVPEVEQSMLLECRLLSTNLADEVEVKIGGESVPPGGNVFFRGQARDVELIAKPDSPIAGHPIALTRTVTSPLQPSDLSSAPPFDPFQTTHKWRVTGANRSGTFQLHMTAQGMTTAINVTANKLLSTNLADEVEVKIGGESVPSAGNVFFRGQAKDVELIPKPGSPIAGHRIALTRTVTSSLQPSDLSSAPPFDPFQTTHKWRVTGANRSGTFQLHLTAQGMTTPIDVTANKLLSSNLADEVEVKIGGQSVPSAGNVFFRGQAKDVELIAKPGSPITGHPIALTRTVNSPLQHNDLSSAPRFDPFQTTHKWRVTGANRSGTFQLHMTAQGMTTPINVTANKLLSTNLADEADVKIDNKDTSEAGTAFLRKMRRNIKLVPKPNSPLAGLAFIMRYAVLSKLSPGAVESVPAIGAETSNLEWDVGCISAGDGAFRLELYCPRLESSVYIECKQIDVSYNVAGKNVEMIDGVGEATIGDWGKHIFLVNASPEMVGDTVEIEGGGFLSVQPRLPASYIVGPGSMVWRMDVAKNIYSRPSEFLFRFSGVGDHVDVVNVHINESANQV